MRPRARRPKDGFTKANMNGNGKLAAESALLPLASSQDMHSPPVASEFSKRPHHPHKMPSVAQNGSGGPIDGTYLLRGIAMLVQ